MQHSPVFPSGLPGDAWQPGRNTKTPASQAAFALLDLLLSLGMICLLAVLVGSAIGHQRSRARQLVCLNNLSQVGQAFMVWGADHRDRLPLTTPWWEGGTVPRPQSPPGGVPPPPWISGGLYNNIWFHYWWLSNELASPKYLACPADAEKRPASDYSTSAQGGFLNNNYLVRAVSYTLNHPSLQFGRALLSTDRSASYSFAPNTSCTYGYTPNTTFNFATAQTWGDSIHPRSGNLLFTDGSVEQADERGLSEAVGQVSNDNGQPHYLNP